MQTRTLVDVRNQLKKDKQTVENDLAASTKELETSKKLMAVANSRINNLTREKDNAVKLYGKQVTTHWTLARPSHQRSDFVVDMESGREGHTVVLW